MNEPPVTVVSSHYTGSCARQVPYLKKKKNAVVIAEMCPRLMFICLPAKTRIFFYLNVAFFNGF
jgi:hypothetical protein